jgi:sugar-specific transcriptional regulator TrmB
MTNERQPQAEAIDAEYRVLKEEGTAAHGSEEPAVAQDQPPRSPVEQHVAKRVTEFERKLQERLNEFQERLDKTSAEINKRLQEQLEQKSYEINRKLKQQVKERKKE